jgi:outer membrane murein-binding lipoprotein Lpp
MRRLAILAALLTATACEKPSKLDGQKAGPGQGMTNAGGGASNAQIAQLESIIRDLETKVKALEDAHKIGAPIAGGSGGNTDAAVVERLQRIEASLIKREEALSFLDMAYAQQKQQMEQREANEPDDSAVFAVDISKALANNQVEGPNSAIVTVVEAWDFA